MKKPLLFLVFGMVAAGALLSGCSKAKTPPPAATGQADAGSATADAGATAVPDGPVELKIKWAAGKTFPMRMSLNQTVQTKVPGQSEAAAMEVKIAQDFNLSAIKQLENGGWELELKFENQTMDISQGGKQLLSFDTAQSSAADTNNPAAAILRAMIGVRLQYFTDAAGKVQSMGGMADLMKRIDAAAKPQQRGMFHEMFSEDTLKRYGSFSDALPNRMVSPGDSWPVKNDIASGIGTLTLDMNYTFKNWEQHNDRRCAHMVGTGGITSKSISAAMVGAAVEIQKGKLADDFWFDPEAGMIVDVHDNQDMTLKITTRSQSLTQELHQQVRVALMDTP